MPFQSTTLRVVIVSPSDVGPTREAVVQCIQEWTSEHSYRLGVTLLPIRWETDASPDIGRPQEVINTQIIDPADIVVAVFRSKVGSPTGREDSGTIEEIKRGIDQGKRVMIYFSRNEADGTNPDADQTEKLKLFKLWCKEKALYFEYDTAEHLVAQLRHHLSSSVDTIMARLNRDAAPSTISSSAILASENDVVAKPTYDSGNFDGDVSPTTGPAPSTLEPLDTGLVRRDVQLRACLDLAGMQIAQLTEEEIHFRFTLTNIGRHPASITNIHITNAGEQVYDVFSPHGESYTPNNGRIHQLRVPRAFAVDRKNPERWRFDMSVDFADGAGKNRSEYVFYMEGIDPDFRFQEDKDAAILSPICRRRRV